MTSIYASGGTITINGNTYFHRFTSASINDVFTATQAITVNYILVGGGNGQGQGSSGGDGGKILIVSTPLSQNDTIAIAQIGSGGTTSEITGGNTIISINNGPAISSYTSTLAQAVGGSGGDTTSMGDGGDGEDGYSVRGYPGGLTVGSGGGGGSEAGTSGSGGAGGAGNSDGYGGGNLTVGGDGSANSGGGGGGSGGDGGGGGGGSGVVIIYYTIGGGSVCFLEGTPVETDQGEVAIDKLDTKLNTINGKRILAVTQTPGEKDCLVIIKKDLLGENKPNKDTIISKWHRVFYDEEMEEACRIPDTELVPYNGEILYNVLMDEHETMKVNGLTVETLDPDHKVAKFYRSLL